MSEAPALSPEALQALLKQDPAQRAAWMLEDVAQRQEAWGLEDAQGWVLAQLAQPFEGARYALPLWPRQELAALEARDAGEQPRAVDLESLLEELLPEVQERGWAVLAFSVKDRGETFNAADFSSRLAATWEALAEED